MDRCSECRKQASIYDLVQVKDKYPNSPRYKLVCVECYQKGDYHYVGKIRRLERER